MSWRIPQILAIFLISNIDAAWSLTINRQFIEPGTSFSLPGSRTILAGDAPSNAAGEGELETIFARAADIWETLILDDYTVNLSFAWVNLEAIGVQALAVSPVFDSSIPPKGNIIGFNNNIASSWFIDATPSQNEEYQRREETFFDLGGGSINISRTYTASISIAQNRYDLLSIAIHEIGHSLGFITSVPSFNVPGNPNLTFPNLIIESPLSFSGTVIPTTTTGGGHINLSETLMAPIAELGTRKYPSNLDLLAIAQVSGFRQIDLKLARPVKEPNIPWWALGLTIAICLVTQKNRR